ncbi:hypothetical protein [Gordonia humi]|uniref:Uncharacterized protein n=1 Tax=Gordonia humi TaxID=686429 RepID=A0A840EWY8_9ACTN|nr:hypothetical protein [Gordonia humi]MBB4134848.1 hypothetical protein [Gordonia humi]
MTAVEDAPFTGPSIAVTVDVDNFDRVAVRAGGTPNSLFVALVVGVLAASGRVVDGEDVPVELPVSLRGTDDLRANATAAASAVTPAGRYDDLSELRRACREAYVRRERTTSPMAATVVVAQALPDRLIARIADGVGAPLCLASGLGALPDTVASLGGAAAGPVMMRAATVGASAARIAGLGGGVSGWCTRGPAVVTICLGSLDPVAVPDRSRLAELFGDELAKWDLSASVWLE